MLRASLTLLLLGVSAVAFAQNGRAGAAGGNATTCQEIADKSVDASSSLPTEARRARTASAVRSKYAGHAASATTTRGGGDDDDTPLPRSRGSKWHSFLPGMFR